MQFKTRSGLLKHTKKFHKEETFERSIVCREKDCDYSTRQISTLRRHLETQHKLIFKVQTLKFPNENGNALCLNCII